MLSPGDPAPSFALPAVVDGQVVEVSLGEYLGDDVVVLAFYPGDFNPACTEDATGLDTLDILTMQKNVTVLAISGDSVYSHRAFAAEYDLQLPLLADVHGEVAEEYGVATETPDAGYRTERAVVVVGPSGRVEYAWRTDDPTHLPEIEAIQSSVDGIGDTDAARARYRLAHAHYTEGRRTLTSAMHALEQEEWVLAQHDFSRAHDEFATARNQFNAAARFAEDTVAISHYGLAENKTEALWRATEWLTEAASEYASGNAMLADRLRGDAETSLEEARSIGEPPDPDDFPLEEPPAGMSSAEPEGPSLTLEENPDETTTDSGERSGDIEGDVDDAELEAIASELEDEFAGSASDGVGPGSRDGGDGHSGATDGESDGDSDGYEDWDWAEPGAENTSDDDGETDT